MTWDLRLGSCLDPVTGLASLTDKSVDVVITDPPYEAEAHTKGRRTKPGNWALAQARGAVDVCQPAPLPFSAVTEDERERAGWHIARLTRRWSIVFCQIEAVPLWREAICSAPFGHEYIRTCIWSKPDGQPQFTGDRPGMGYEAILVTHSRGRKQWNGGGRLGVFTHGRERGPSVNGCHDGAPHPTTKPLPLMRELVSLFSDPGELVLDPFAGSGSTGVACNQLGRHFLGWELSPEYHAIATRRLSGDEAKPRPKQPSLLGWTP